MLRNLVVFSLLLVTQSPDLADRSDIVEIDGRLHPELIPEYRAWEATFFQLSSPTTTDDLPTVLLRAFQPRDIERLRAAATRAKANRTQCWDRLKTAREPLQRLETAGADRAARYRTAKQIDPVIWDIELSCRWDTLHIRDQLLEDLSPDGAVAMRGYVESNKAGMSVSVPKSGLDRFRQPQ